MASSKAAEVVDPPAYLPSRRPVSLPNLSYSGAPPGRTSPNGTTMSAAPPLPHFLPPRIPVLSIRRSGQSTVNSVAQERISRTVSRQNSSNAMSTRQIETALQRTASGESARRPIRKSAEDTPRSVSLERIRDNDRRQMYARTRHLRSPSRPLRQSSLRLVSRPSDDEVGAPAFPSTAALAHSHSDLRLAIGRNRPHTHPSSRADARTTASQLNLEDLGSLRNGAHLRSGSLSRPSTPSSLVKPKPSFARLSSLDNVIQYREEKEEWRRMSRSSSLARSRLSEAVPGTQAQERAKTFAILDDSINAASDVSIQGEPMAKGPSDDVEFGNEGASENQSLGHVIRQSKFRNTVTEVGFGLTVAMTQFLAEYLISGFAIELPRILRTGQSANIGSTGMFWPASLLSLILSAMLLFFARLSDMYSGYGTFMFGVSWLALWTLTPGVCSQNLILLDVSRAMQGLAIAAFTPSAFVMIGTIYQPGQRKNLVLGVYAACAPLGFFAGFATAAALPIDAPQWYFRIAFALALLTLVMSYLSVPVDRTNRRILKLKMDWIGSGLIVAGLILVSYALAVEPHESGLHPGKIAWVFPTVFAPFASGTVCLSLAFWYEGWCATCPLLPFDFFKAKSVKPLSLACLCFYASYGVWLYNSAQYFQNPTATTRGAAGLSGDQLALWYLPTALGGLILCVVSAWLTGLVPMMCLLLLSALAWIAAPLLLALAPLPLRYWSFVMPSMLCATIGIDITFTVCIVYFSSVQPLKYQGLSGAVCSSLVNLAMSFALSISEIVMKKGSSSSNMPPDAAANWGYKAGFFYAAGSAGVGLFICILMVRLPRIAVQQHRGDEEVQLSPTYSETTLVDGISEQHDDEEEGIRPERVGERN